MKTFFNYIFSCFVAFCVSAPAYSFVVSNENQRVSLNAHLSYIEDLKGALKFEELADLKAQGRLKENPGDTLNFGFSDSAYWIHTTFRFSELILENESWVLSLDYAPLKHIDLYIKTVDGIAHINSGTSQPFNSRPVLHRNFIYPLKGGGGDEFEIWLRVASDSSVQVPLSLWPAQKYFEYETLSSYGWGLWANVVCS